MSTKIKLLIILLLALLIRCWNIDTLPSLNPDEAALGYNAYSLLKTGLDEHGNPWPIHFKSFGDYKPGGYVYLDLPFIKIFGLTPLAVRLPNLIFSVLTIFILYRLVLILTLDFRLSLLSSFVLTLSPWHIHFSRGAWESNTALFFILLGVYWFYSFVINHKSYFLYLFPLPLVVSLYTYHSARIIIPILFLILFFIHKSLFLNHKLKFLVSLLIAFFLTLPVFISFLKSGGTTRFSGVGLFSDTGPLSRSEELLNQHPGFTYLDRVIHNKRVLYILSWGQKYLSHFDPNFLFLKGDEVPRSKSPDMGQLYLIELPLIFFGLLYLFKNKNIIIKSPKDVYPLLKEKITNFHKEYFMVVSLDNRNKVISVDVVSIGTLSSSLIHPRETFEMAIKNHAGAIIISHNHPSCELKPSKDDLIITQTLVKAGKILGIEITDHLIICKDDYFSFKERKII